jgi:Neuraminidase (sialidase)
MKHNRVDIMIFIVAFICLLTSAINSNAQVSQIQVVAPITDTYSRHSYVTLTEVSPGKRIMLVWTRSQGEGKDYDKNDIVMAHSDDNGKTWTEPVVLPCGKPRSCFGGTSLLKLPDRIQLYFWFRNGGNDSSLRMIESTDGGTIWSDSRTITPRSATSFTGCNQRVIQLKTGRLIWPVHTLTGKPDPSKNLGILVGRSDDLGKTWKFSPDLAFEDDPNVRGYRYTKTLSYTPDEHETRIPIKLHEASVVECMDGSLLMYTRSTRGRFYSSRSTDGGVTWSKLEPSDVAAQTSPPYLQKLTDGRLLMLWNPPTPEQAATKQFPTSKRPTLQMALSEDSGKTWSKPTVIANDGRKNGFCYPAALELKNSKELLVFMTRSPEIIYPGALVSVRVPLK